MTLTKLKLRQSGTFEYVNFEQIQFVDVHSDYYEIYFGSSVAIEIDKTDPTITGLIDAADVAYGA